MRWTEEDEERGRARRKKGDEDRAHNSKFAKRRKKNQRKRGRKRQIKGH